MMFYYAAEPSPGIWRIYADYRPVGGGDISLFGAINEHVAKGTAEAMNEARK
jgi:hypothetical protein